MKYSRPLFYRHEIANIATMFVAALILGGIVGLVRMAQMTPTHAAMLTSDTASVTTTVSTPAMVPVVATTTVVQPGANHQPAAKTVTRQVVVQRDVVVSQTPPVDTPPSTTEPTTSTSSASTPPSPDGKCTDQDAGPGWVPPTDCPTPTP